MMNFNTETLGSVLLRETLGSLRKKCEIVLENIFIV
jgi:hypothetical protein